MSTKLEGIKNQDYGSNDEIENKLKFDKIFKNQNLKSKHLGHNVKYHQTLNLKVKLKRKIKLTKESKTKNKNQENEDQI